MEVTPKAIPIEKEPPEEDVEKQPISKVSETSNLAAETSNLTEEKQSSLEEQSETEQPVETAAVPAPEETSDSDSEHKHDFSNPSPVNLENKEEESSEQDEESYDPEVAFNDPKPTSVVPDSPSSSSDEHRNLQNVSSDDGEDDYDPEVALKNDRSQLEKSPPVSTPADTILKGKRPAGLPPKPTVIASSIPSPSIIDPNQQLQEAYNAIMQSELVKDPKFVQLPQDEQLKLISDQLQKNNVNLASSSSSSSNYDQVYSYNKPYKNVKDPIPLVPVNEFCRRPNITLPMTFEEEKAYQEFIDKEAYYMELQNWDEFADNSRLFVGNLPANTVSKQDLFRIFSQYGEVIQITIKAGYGFVQFRTPEACLECIKGETNVPLHNKIMRLDASRPQQSRNRPPAQDNTAAIMTSRGRERFPEEDRGAKRRKAATPDCQLYINDRSSVFFIRKVKKTFENSNISVQTEDVTNKPIGEVISEAAYSGILATCVIKESKVDIQTFETAPGGAVKFDEYADVEPDVAAEIVSKAKQRKNGGSVPEYFPEDNYDVSNTAASPSAPNPAPYNQDPRLGSSSANHNYGNHGRGRGGGGRHNDGKYQKSQKRYGNSRNQDWGNRGSNDPRYNRASAYDQQYDQSPYNDQSYKDYPAQQFPPASYGSPQQQFAPQDQSQANLVSALQGLDPSSMQNMINILQSQQQAQTQAQPQAPYQQPYPQQNRPPPPGHGEQRYNQYGNPNNRGPASQHHTNTSNNQASSLLSQLQDGPQDPYRPQPQNGQPSSTLALMETLARLGRR